MACSGCQWRDSLGHGGILFGVVHAVCLATNNSNRRTLQHVLQSVQRPMTDLEMFRWGGVAQALQCLGFRGEAGPFDWMRTRCEAVTWNNSSGCTTQTKIKVETISRIHDTWNDFHSCTIVHESCLFDQEVSSNRTCKPLSSLRWLVWWKGTSRTHLKTFEISLRLCSWWHFCRKGGNLWARDLKLQAFLLCREELFCSCNVLTYTNHFACNIVINFAPNQTCECACGWQWCCCRTMQEFFDMETPFTRHCGTRIFPMKWGGSHWHHDFDDDEAWKVWKAVGLHG